jgi:hypothetical protein
LRFNLTIALALSLLAPFGCGTTQVMTDDPTARIWANGQMIGRGHGELQKRGSWETTSLMVRAEDGRQQVTTVKRSITGLTVVGAIFTYGLCLLFCWEYPDTVWASLPSRQGGFNYADGGGGGDPWMTPPPGWQPKSRAVSPATMDQPSPKGSRAPGVIPAPRAADGDGPVSGQPAPTTSAPSPAPVRPRPPLVW